MSRRPEITAMLSLALEKKINPYNDPRIYWAKEVTFDYSTNHAVRVDYIRYKPVNNTVSGIEKGDFYCYEVKSSVEDAGEDLRNDFVGGPALRWGLCFEWNRINLHKEGQET